MGDYPVIYWLVVLIVEGAVSAVLIWIGYLYGRRAAIREAAADMRLLNASIDRVRRTMLHQSGAR